MKRLIAYLLHRHRLLSNRFPIEITNKSNPFIHMKQNIIIILYAQQKLIKF